MSGLGRSPRSSRSFVITGFVLLAGYYLFRLGLTAMDLTQGIPLDHEPFPGVRSFLDASEAFTGIVGLAGVPGLYLMKRWGWWATVVASVYAIAFDAWAAVAVQLSAAGGVIPPVVVLSILLLYRRRFFTPAPMPPATPATQA